MQRRSGHCDLNIDERKAAESIRNYNNGSYKGVRNLELDSQGYEMFRDGLSSHLPALVKQLIFTGDNYGGAQARFMVHSIEVESRFIAEKILGDFASWESSIRAAPPLQDGIVELDRIECLLLPFHCSKRWLVWASKTLQFLRPEAFPIVDSQVVKALGVSQLNTAKWYRKFCGLIRDTLINNSDVLNRMRTVDCDRSPSKLKLLDKILFVAGRPKQDGRCLHSIEM
ncbi:MAG: hypothetical protein SGJ20_17065 [Planctomycetota bacterium]|nr:hypothetical protein [Planctomycetota bacterium]